MDADPRLDESDCWRSKSSSETDWPTEPSTTAYTVFLTLSVSLLLYAYYLGIRSSRQIERACRGDVAFRVITAMEVPDHSTVAEFRRRHQDSIAVLFVEVLGLCAEAGLVELGEISVDGTKLRASASYDRNRGYASIVEEILGEAEQADRAEDERLG